MRLLRTTARLHDVGLVLEDDGDAAVSPSSSVPDTAPSDVTRLQASRARQRLRCLSAWSEACGEQVKLHMREGGTSASGTLVACDGDQSQLLLRSLSTAIGTYTTAAVHTSDLTHVDLGGDWVLDITPRVLLPGVEEPEESRADDAEEREGGDAMDSVVLAAAQERAGKAACSDGAVIRGRRLQGGTEGSEAAGKYWAQRLSLWSKYAEGVRMDAEGWFSVTPERLAEYIAERCRCDLVLDPFVGVGGNAVQFAFQCERVIAVDLDRDRLDLAMHNARVYGVSDRIDFVHGDFLQLASRLRADVVFLSPPWGGPGYADTAEFDLQTMMGGIDGVELLRLALTITPHVAYYLPRNVGVGQLACLAAQQAPEYGGVTEAELCMLNGWPKAIVAYFGELAGASVAADEGDQGGAVGGHG